jgi:hypothetical protein
MKKYIIILWLILGFVQAQTQRRTYEYDDLNRLNKVNVWAESKLCMMKALFEELSLYQSSITSSTSSKKTVLRKSQ